jgi:hypothetical protein
MPKHDAPRAYRKLDKALNRHKSYMAGIAQGLHAEEILDALDLEESIEDYLLQKEFENLKLPSLQVQVEVDPNDPTLLLIQSSISIPFIKLTFNLGDANGVHPDEPPSYIP